MKYFFPGSRTRIKSNARPIVKRPGCLVLFAIFLGFSLAAQAEAPPPPIDEDTSIDTEEETIPNIEARSFAVSVLRKTRSAFVYLLSVTQGELPGPGRILLAKRGENKVMAFRVLRLYPEKQEFAARKVRVYNNHPDLLAGEEFSVIEKLSDIWTAEPTEADQAELNELEGVGSSGPMGPSLDYDPELDAESSPPPAGAVDSSSEMGEGEAFAEDTAAEEEPDTGLIIEEVTPLETHPHSITTSFGYFHSGEGSNFPGGGARLNLRLAKMMFLEKPLLQDSLSLEAGFFYYKAILSESDVFGVVPLIGTLRYNIHFSEDLSSFVYGGVMKNLLFPVEGYTEETYDALNSLIPAFGLGLLFRIGPSWEARLDLGYDMIGAGLSISF